MQFSDYCQILCESEPDQWIRAFGGNMKAGPAYHLGWEQGERKGVPYLEPMAHTETAVYMPDLSISLAWGYEWQERWPEEWTKKFPDAATSGHFVDAFYNGVLVLRQEYFVVDGGRCLLPMASREGQVPAQLASFIRLVHRISRANGVSYDEYFDRAGFTATARPWPR